MTDQFIAHADEPRTFADKKGATKAIKRDLAKHFDAHGDTLYDTGFEAQQTADGRFGVVVFCDLTPDSAKKLVGNELAGYVIQPDLKEEPKPRSTAPAPEGDKPKRRKGLISVEPTAPLIPCRAGSVQQAMLDAMWEDGATIADLRKVCVKKKDGQPWTDASIRSAFYYDLKDKGYGTRTEFNDDEPTYFIVLPEGIDAPLPAKQPKS